MLNQRTLPNQQSTPQSAFHQTLLILGPQYNCLENYKHRVAVVILNYNGKNHLKKYLPSVVRYSSNYHIVVADNASNDDSVAFLKTDYPDIELIQNEHNGGFAKGYNDALKHVDAEYYILLNSDVEVTENWVEPLLEILESDTTIAGCQPIVNSYVDRTKFEHAGAAGGFLDRDYYPFCRGRIFEQVETDEGQYNSTREIFWATGACMMIRAKDFHEAEGFDTSFFAHMEEIDLCWRLKKMGRKFFVVGNAQVFHLGGGTLNYMSPKKTFLNFRNSLFMITKNYDGLLFPKLFKRLILDGLATLQFLISGQFKHILALLQAHFSFYAHLPELLKKRKNLKAHSGQKFNSSGLYKKSIIVERYLRHKTKFSQLQEQHFEK